MVFFDPALHEQSLQHLLNYKSDGERYEYLAHLLTRGG